MKEGELNSGNYARYFQIDKKVYWDHNTSKKQEFEVEIFGDLTLPSSSLKRKEIELIKEEKFDEADK